MRCLFSAVCALFLLSAGCSLSGTSRILVVLPQAPTGWEEYPENPGFILTYAASDNGEIKLYLPPLTETVTISLDKGNNKPVVLTPYLGDPQLALRPAGALNPLHSSDPGILPLSWEEGFLADLIFSLNSESVPADHINCVRLSEAIGEAGKGDPWSLDKERIVQALRFYSFRQDYVSLLEHRSLEIRLAEGAYLWNNPNLPPVESETAGLYCFDALYEGEHILFPVDGSEPIRIVILRDEWFIFYPECVESGSW